MKRIEIIVPCYNEQECISLLYSELEKTFAKLKSYMFSVLFVNDGSKDDTLDEIRKLADIKGNEKVKYISLARNFGKESAIFVGLSNCTGDYIVLMDADLQHPPALIKDMILAMEEGYDCCAARRVSRKGEPLIRSTFSNMFYHFINKVTAMNLHAGETDYRMMTQQVVQAIISLRERERFIKGIYSWVGFDTKWIEYKNVERVAGKTKWSFIGLLKYAESGFVAFATTPLRGVVYLGMFIVLVAFVMAITVFVSALCSDGPRTGYATILLVMLFLGGVIITILGVIGEYLARIYMEVKNRPLYIIKESNLRITKEKDCDFK